MRGNSRWTGPACATLLDSTAANRSYGGDTKAHTPLKKFVIMSDVTAIWTIQQAAATIAQKEVATVVTAAQATAIKTQSGQARNHSPVHTSDAKAIMKLPEPLKAAAKVAPVVAGNVGLMGIVVAAGIMSTLLLWGGWEGTGEAGGKENAEEDRAGSSAACLLRSFRA